ncbi:MAG TPA: hypothetical protein PLK37_10160 [Terricaulis sp.]|nr:hypothetical protein [Terricaulis sp.]
MLQNFTRFIAGACALALVCMAAPAFAQTARPYALEQLAPEVRAAVENARDAQRRALMAAARSYGEDGGLVRFTGTGGDSYLGECAPCSSDGPQRHGHGVLTWPDGELYAGQHVAGGNGGMKHGYGVYIFVDGDVYEGQLSNEHFAGYGVRWDSQGRVRYQGQWANGSPQQ